MDTEGTHTLAPANVKAAMTRIRQLVQYSTEVAKLGGLSALLPGGSEKQEKLSTYASILEVLNDLEKSFPKTKAIKQSKPRQLPVADSFDRPDEHSSWVDSYLGPLAERYPGDPGEVYGGADPGDVEHEDGGV